MNDSYLVESPHGVVLGSADLSTLSIEMGKISTVFSSLLAVQLENSGF